MIGKFDVQFSVMLGLTWTVFVDVGDELGNGF